MISDQPFLPLERRAVTVLAVLYVLRMLGLFMVLPLLAIYANDLPGASPQTVGLALGAYGLTQATLQIPMGWLSDLIDRRKVIVGGLLLLAVGSLIAALATSIMGIILGRFIQGSGAIASATMALAADYTRVEQRTKASAIIGASIALAFGLALVLGPALAAYGGISLVFIGTALAALFGITLVATLLPKPALLDTDRAAQQHRVERARIVEAALHTGLPITHISVFCLHFLLMALFVLVPNQLEMVATLPRSQHAWVYLITLLLAVPGVFILIRRRRIGDNPRTIMLWCLSILCLSLVCLLMGGRWVVLVGLILFFAGFTALEAVLPSLVSVFAPISLRGTAMGVFASSQFFGVFIGGILGGYLLEELGPQGLLLGLGILMSGWCVAIILMARRPKEIY